MPEYHAGKAADYTEGDRKVLACGDAEIGVFLIDGQFYAWHNRCSHRAGPVCQGRIMKRVVEPVDAGGRVRTLDYHDSDVHIVCPWHGYEFDLATGCHPGDSTVHLTPVKVAVRDGEIFVSVPK
jgi:nitrite reductase (NADH) small subunit